MGVKIVKWFAYVVCGKWYHKFALEFISFTTVENEPYILEMFSVTLDEKPICWVITQQNTYELFSL